MPVLIHQKQVRVVDDQFHSSPCDGTLQEGLAALIFWSLHFNPIEPCRILHIRGPWIAINCIATQMPQERAPLLSWSVCVRIDPL